MGLPQIILMALFAINFCIVAAKHGQPQKNYDVRSTLLAAAIDIALLWWGGFFG